MRRRNDKIGEISSYLNSPQSKKANTDDRKEEDIKKFMGLCKNICKVNIMEESLEKAIRLGKASDDEDRPLLVTLREEIKKRGILKNLNKIREAGAPFDKVTIAHDLTIKQKKRIKGQN